MDDLELAFMREAKEAFAEEYGPRVEELGYHLGPGITKVDDVSAIFALIHSTTTKDIPEAVRQQIDGFIPQNYLFKERDIPVKLEYTGKIVASSH